MLGIDRKEIPVVEGKYATEMREALGRIRNGYLTNSDKKAEERPQKIKEMHNVTWN